MTRPLPLALLALLFMWLAANVDTMWMWLITVVCLAGLVALIMAMRFRDMYRGPSSLSDDFRNMSRRVMRDEGGEADRIAYLNELDEREEERARLIHGVDDYDDDEDDDDTRRDRPTRRDVGTRQDKDGNSI